MRAETLVFLHLLAAVVLFGGALAVAILATSEGADGRVAVRASVLTAAAALATVSLGEAAKARADATGTWLDVGSVLGYAGLLAPSIALVFVSRRALDDPRWRVRAAGLAWAMVIVSLSTAFVMAAKPS